MNPGSIAEAGLNRFVSAMQDSDGGDKFPNSSQCYSPKFMDDAIKLTAEARLKGENPPPTYIIPSVLITKENAKDFYFPDSPF
jgi:ribose transport system substrate-binding protein